MRRRTFAALLVALCACGGGGPPKLGGGRFEPARSARKPAGSPTGRRVVLAAHPPARLFAGSQSVEGALSRYCTPDGCATLTPGPYGQVRAPAGVPVIFALSASPAQATLDVRPAAGGAAAVQQLVPSSSMYWNVSVPNGSYVLTLSTTYPSSQVSWEFGLTVTAPD